MKLIVPVLMIMAVSLFDKTAKSEIYSVSEPITAEVIEEKLDIQKGSLNGITVTSLPNSDDGRLICEGVEVMEYDYLPRKSLDWLVFESFSYGCAASFSALPDIGKEACECVVLIGNNGDTQNVLISSDILAWKQAENRYFCDVAEGF